MIFFGVQVDAVNGERRPPRLNGGGGGPSRKVFLALIEIEDFHCTRQQKSLVTPAP
jgi:hypothetical protein